MTADNQRIAHAVWHLNGERRLRAKFPGAMEARLFVATDKGEIALQAWVEMACPADATGARQRHGKWCRMIGGRYTFDKEKTSQPPGGFGAILDMVDVGLMCLFDRMRALTEGEYYPECNKPAQPAETTTFPGHKFEIGDRVSIPSEGRHGRVMAIAPFQPAPYYVEVYPGALNGYTYLRLANLRGEVKDCAGNWLREDQLAPYSDVPKFDSLAKVTKDGLIGAWDGKALEVPPLTAAEQARADRSYQQGKEALKRLEEAMNLPEPVTPDFFIGLAEAQDVVDHGPVFKVLSEPIPDVPVCRVPDPLN